MNMKLQADPPAPEGSKHLKANTLERSNLYAFFRRELDEINRHKWLESEKAGQDMGFEWALFDWVRKHRSQWRDESRS